MDSSVIQLAYLGPGGPEFMLVMLVLLLMFGAKEAPRILRTLNDIINQIRNTADGFKREVMYGDLNAEPRDQDADEYDDDYNPEYGFDDDPGHDEDYEYDRHADAGRTPDDIEAEPETETSENGEDDARKD